VVRQDEPSEFARTTWVAIIVVVCLGLALRVGMGLATATDGEALPDQGEYLQLAQSVLAGEGLVLVDERYATDQTLRAQRMFGYPLFLAATGANATAAKLTQALVGATTVLATFLITRRLLADSWSVLAAGLVAVHPFLVYFSTLLLTETAFTSLVTWGTLCLLKSRERSSWWLIAALLFMAATYVRPTGAVWFVGLALVVSLLPGKRWRWPLPVGATCVLVIALALSPWIVRNWIVLGRLVPTTTNGGITLYDGHNPDNLTGGSDQSFVQRMPHLALMDEVQRSSFLRSQAVKHATSDWRQTAVVTWRKVLRTWSPVPLNDGATMLQKWAGGLFAVPVLLLASVGLIISPMPWRLRLVLATPALLVTLLHAATVGSLRYRLPAEPLIAILAVGGLASLWSLWANRRRLKTYEETQPT
jgi:4-amino-4-deoxy-L-arabinose transferase-like glycosyltransferase